jgi:hypothetical protein
MKVESRERESSFCCDEHSGFFALPHAPASTRETLAVQCGFGTGLDGPALVVLSDMHEVPPATLRTRLLLGEADDLGLSCEPSSPGAHDGRLVLGARSLVKCRIERCLVWY